MAEEKENKTQMKSQIELNDAKILTLMQFARKAGKLVSGTDACIRAINHRKVYLVLMTTDFSKTSAKHISAVITAQKLTISIISRFQMSELSDALGLPVSGVFGILDQGFASRISEYAEASIQVEETCQYEYTS